MTFRRFSIGLAAAAVTLSLSSAWAQDERGRPQSEPSRPSNGDTVGSAAPRGGGGSPSSNPSSNPGSSGSASSSSSSGSSAAPPSSWIDGGSSRYDAPRAPVRPDRAAERADQRRGNGATTGRAVPRGESGGKAAGNAGSTSASSGSESQPSEGRSRPVPTYSRPRDGRPQTGTAVERTGPPPDGHGHNGGYYPYYPGYGYGYVYDPFYSFYYNPFYGSAYYWNPYGYGYGLGYFSYDPFLFGGAGYSGYYGGGGYDPSYYGGGGSGGYSPNHYQGSGSLRLKIKPENAQVYIDGFFVGVVDSFDGVFQRLAVDAGPHRVELRAEGYQTTEFEVMVTPGDTVTYKGELKRR